MPTPFDMQLANISPRRLSDGSKVYDVTVYDTSEQDRYVTFPCIDERAATRLRDAVRESVVAVEVTDLTNRTESLERQLAAARAAHEETAAELLRAREGQR